MQALKPSTVQDTHGRTPLISAVGNTAVTKAMHLFLSFTNVNTADYSGDIPLHLAAVDPEGNDFVAGLVAKGSDVSRANALGWTPGHIAAMVCLWNLEIKSKYYSP
jgi:ankyrin repeat protein